jgi:hypothetical protein
MDGVGYLRDLFSELGGTRRCLYFGDLDPQGLLIPQEASKRARAVGLPEVEPDLWSYHHLLALASHLAQPWQGDPPSISLCQWLGASAQATHQLFLSRRRLAQEAVGWEFLKNQTPTPLRALDLTRVEVCTGSPDQSSSSSES